MGPDLASAPLLKSAAPRGGPVSVVIVQGQTTARLPMAELAGLVVEAMPVEPTPPTPPAITEAELTAAIAEHNTDPLAHGLNAYLLTPKALTVLDEATGRTVWNDAVVVPVFDEASFLVSGLV